jgi:hypothetical protein
VLQCGEFHSEIKHLRRSVLWNLGARKIAESPLRCITTNITL